MKRACTRFAFLCVTLLTLLPRGASADDADACFKGSGDAAIAACTRRIEHHRNSTASNARQNLAVVYYSRGYEYLMKGDHRRALDDFEASWQTNPAYARALYSRGLAKQKLGDAKGGQADIDRAKAMEPSLPN